MNLYPSTRPNMRAIALGICLFAVTAAAGELRVRQSDAAISVLDGDAVVLVYNKQSPEAPEGIDPIYRRSGFLHPVASPAGNVVTAAFPSDHPHQHGIFTAWVSTTYDDRDVDFWNLAKRNGRVLHERVVRTFNEEGNVGFEVDLIHRATVEPAVDVLRERWTVTVYPTDGTHHCFDLRLNQQALTDKPLTINKYHYGGAAVRGPVDWIESAKQSADGNDDRGRSKSEISNDRGSDRIEGNHQTSRWVTLAGARGNQEVSITMLDHPDNFRSPQPARLHPTKPYFCFAPCVIDAFEIDKSHPYQARYRYLVTDARPEPAWLEQQWQDWSSKR